MAEKCSELETTLTVESSGWNICLHYFFSKQKYPRNIWLWYVLLDDEELDNVEQLVKDSSR